MLQSSSSLLHTALEDAGDGEVGDTGTRTHMVLFCL